MDKKDYQADTLKYRIPSIRTLNMLKMEKNFIALEKGYPRQPYFDKNQSLGWFIEIRLNSEYRELIKAFDNNDILNMKEELADMSNIIDYIFEMLVYEEEKRLIDFTIGATEEITKAEEITKKIGMTKLTSKELEKIQIEKLKLKEM